MAGGIGWKRFDHFALAASDARAALDFHAKLFGLPPGDWFESPDEGFRGGVLQMPGGQGTVEVVEPYDGESFLHRFLAERGPGVHHITVEVEDIEAAVAYLREEMGIEPLREIFSDGEWRQTFIHPRDTGGVLYQIYEWEPGHGPGPGGT